MFAPFPAKLPRRDSMLDANPTRKHMFPRSTPGLAASIHAPQNPFMATSRIPSISKKQQQQPDWSNLTPEQQRLRRREWNRGPLTDLFPRVPSEALERLLDIAIDKNVTYNLSESAFWNARRLTSIVIAHVRHHYSDYDKLLREDKLERYKARQQSGEKVWRTLREWCPWDESNRVLEKCFTNTLLPPEKRDPTWDPMDIDEDSDSEDAPAPVVTRAIVDHFDDDPMDLD